MEKSPFNEISVMGLGLMGSSLCSIIKETYPDATITGISSETAVSRAVDLKIIDKDAGYLNCRTALEASDLIIICTPISHILALIDEWKANPPKFKKNSIITDIGSTKAEICQSAVDLMKRTDATFIGSHPMAGSEKTGINALDPLLYENAPWILCPTGNESAEQLQVLTVFFESFGCHISSMTPELHDNVVAHVSHLPQLLSTGLAGFLSEQEAVLQNGLQISGGGLRDMSRLANSSYKIWEPIFKSNQKEVNAALINFREYLNNLISVFQNDSLEESFTKGLGLRQKLINSNKMIQADLAEILVDLPDETGILVTVLSHLAKLNLNVLDIEILKVREGESGTLRIGFKKRTEADAAYSCLKESGFSVRPR